MKRRGFREWPRIREIGTGDDFLATMHGTFWKFPADFAPGHAAGVRPRSTYLKVIGDFAAGDREALYKTGAGTLAVEANRLARPSDGRLTVLEGDVAITPCAGGTDPIGE